MEGGAGQPPGPYAMGHDVGDGLASDRQRDALARAHGVKNSSGLIA